MTTDESATRGKRQVAENFTFYSASSNFSFSKSAIMENVLITLQLHICALQRHICALSLKVKLMDINSEKCIAKIITFT